MYKVANLFICVFLLFACSDKNWQGPSVDLNKGNLKISENQRYLVFEDGTPFFYLGDTAWELFHRLSKDDAEKYLENRRSKGFTVIQAVVLAELNGLYDPNTEGNLPLIDQDPTMPNEAYFEHVDWVVDRAAEKGMFVALLPTWGDKWNLKWGVGPVVFTPDNALIFGEYIGSRYRNAKNIIWVLGGDRPIEEDVHAEIIRSMASGIRKGDGGEHLITFHPSGRTGSAQYFHNEEWLDFNMRQNGHSMSYTESYFQTYEEYKRLPVKPIIDSEPIYEDHPINFKPNELGHSTAADVRRTLYWDLFSGALGHTYGHHSVWQMWSDDKSPINYPLMPWYEALDQPGAGQMVYGRLLIESRPFLSRIPDPELIVSDEIQSSVPGAGTYRYVATRDIDGTYIMVYVPIGREFSVKTDKIKSKQLVAWWYNPRNGKALKINKFLNSGVLTLNTPNKGENIDWILVVDDATKNYPRPGKKL